jgi:acetyltransferase-like isoleucine patch superfamily enzyme
MIFLKAILNKFYIKFYIKKNSARYVNWLRNCGVKIGENVFIRPDTCLDLSRPSLLEIGNNVRFGMHFSLFTHDFASTVFLIKYNEFLNSSGRVKIGNNVYFGTNCIVLKGVTIGDNVIVGAGSIVSKDIPANSVACGTPAKVICNIDEYYETRKKLCVEEAFEYARSIKERFNRMPIEADFFEEFPLFVHGNEIDKYSTIPIRIQLGSALSEWEKQHKAIFGSFEEFLKAAGI